MWFVGRTPGAAGRCWGVSYQSVWYSSNLFMLRSFFASRVWDHLWRLQVHLVWALFMFKEMIRATAVSSKVFQQTQNFFLILYIYEWRKRRQSGHLIRFPNWRLLKYVRQKHLLDFILRIFSMDPDVCPTLVLRCFYGPNVVLGWTVPLTELLSFLFVISYSRLWAETYHDLNKVLQQSENKWVNSFKRSYSAL